MANVSGKLQIVERKRGPVYFARFRFPSGRQTRRLLGPAHLQKEKAPASSERDKEVSDALARMRAKSGEGAPDPGAEKRESVRWVPRKDSRPDGYLTEKLAEARLRDLLAKVSSGEIPDPDAAPAPGDGTGPTFRDAAREYLRYVEEVRQIGTKTLADYKGVIEGYLLDEFGGTPIDDITPASIEEYRDRLMREGKLSNRTIVRHLTVINGVFKRAMRKWGVAENPASANMVERPKVVYTGEFTALDRDGIELLASVAESVQDAAIFKVAAFTGMRQGELLALRWDCVDFIGGLVHVRRNFTGGELKIPKGKRVRSVPMMPDVIDTLAALKEREHFTGEGDLVFPNEVGGYLDHYGLRKRYYAALATAGLPKIRFHDLRHCFGSAAITKLDPFAVQSYMGHKHFSTTERYLHHKPRREDAAKLAEAFGSEQTAPEREGVESKT